MTEPSNRSDPLPKEFRQLRILSIEPGTAYHVLCLSEMYVGCFTHFNRKSYVCHGKDCPSHLHSRFDTTWKGYASVAVWLAPRKVWVPWVLEISEHLELDFRTVWKRGQLWEVFREAQTGKRVTPVQAKLLEERDPAKCPMAFDFVPVLLTRYHCRSIDLNVKNPLPPRVFVAEVEGDGPAVLAGPSTDRVDPDFDFLGEMQRRAAEKKRAPSDKKPK